MASILLAMAFYLPEETPPSADGGEGAVSQSGVYGSTLTRKRSRMLNQRLWHEALLFGYPLICGAIDGIEALNQVKRNSSTWFTSMTSTLKVPLSCCIGGFKGPPTRQQGRYINRHGSAERLQNLRAHTL